MANPYLIQALYGPKPTAPAVNNATDDTSDATELVVAASTPTRTELLIETLYGRSHTASPPTAQPKHPARQQSMDLDEPMKDEENDSVPWVTTGSNVLPLVEKHGVVVMAATLPSGTTTRSIVGSTSSTVKPVKVPGALKYPPERYLPPAGPYYDQLNLPTIFGVGFLHEKCFTCWGKRHIFTKGVTCHRTCSICGTKDHREESCSRLYCALSWYCERGIPSRPDSVRYRQFRPIDTEIATLLDMGFITNSSGGDGPIFPNMLHPRVQQFYRDKPSPQILVLETTPTKTKLKRNRGRGLATKFVEPQPSWPAQTSVFRNVVNSSLDPRLQARVEDSSATSTLGPTTSTLLDTTVLSNAQANVCVSGYTLGDKGENTLQQLEDEIMKLKMDNILKDREIRRLRADNEQLRGNGYETGNKRPRM
ncbi:uncharacterized protein K460DRAFT_420099 [Cucurbitaria berberidis CBS 394.84]|uniref:Uncharacterized protein n=1 Tax=Cucurbitaria berberidis CBS 394.84 TaxID=1168544 RepID=A0A9P4GAF2_9PLEO|nr:uncharacterized protein K460DRAFT_420099 [Cucurbitaria berberidis CBS 394.84]KAF1842158.1 hypothetical protein K460DRAFT_420099 [Cucurbitaria berberidis CBS 394.84]